MRLLEILSKYIDCLIIWFMVIYYGNYNELDMILHVCLTDEMNLTFLYQNIYSGSIRTSVFRRTFQKSEARASQ